MTAPATPTPNAPQALDRNHPWPGLAPFDEADCGYFHGRQAETAELLRLVRREPLTVLFGRSGLGKSSLLKAGLFPALRGDDFLPVYLRLDHAQAAPPLADQLQHALQAACAAGQVQASPPALQEGLWSYFHRRDAEFWSVRNRPVTPVIVLDQFEEIFTLGQDGDASTARAAAFLAELADLVENRPPAAVKQTLEHDPAAAGGYDFRRATVKLVLSFREDFLAQMEGLKATMPSVMVNRLRLLPMHGHQAFAVVTEGGGALVDDGVARCILRLAWKNEPAPPVEPGEFDRIEIDPALLSVVCSELNHKRLAATPPLATITPALLAGADREILAGFYERSMAGLDGAVRAFVEDELITDRGFRDSHDWDDALALPGLSRDALGALVARRLLRVDERQGRRRLELTHDVLTRVVMQSRDGRRAREAEAAAEARERAALAQQRANRRKSLLLWAGIATVLMFGVITVWQTVQSRQLLAEARSSRLMATADPLQDSQYDASLLVNLEALRAAPTLDAQAGMLRRFSSHPHLAAVLAAHQGSVKGVAFSPDGQRLASAADDGKVILWDVHSRKLLATLEGHKGEVYSLAFSADGRRLASASRDQTMMLWDVASRKPLVTLEGHKDLVTSVAFSPDGKQLASASADETVILWDLASRKPLVTLEGHRGPVTSIAFSHDGKRLASASADETVILWDLHSRKPLATLKGHKSMVLGVAYSPDGKRLATAGWDKQVILWDLDKHKPLTTFDGHKEPVNGLTFSPDGKQLASASYDQTVILWNLDSGEPLVTLAGHKGWVNSVAFSPDGKQLASASADQTVILWDLSSRKALVMLDAHKDRVNSVAFSPNGTQFASASADQTVILWNPDSRKPLATLEGHKGWVNSVAFSPDGKQLASASADKTVIVWDLHSRKPLATLEGHKGAISSVAYRRDGKRLATAGWDKTVILWDLGNYKLLSTLEGHQSPVTSLAFSPDGKRLATASADRTMILWDLDSRKPLATLEGHKHWITSVAFSPDGKRLASASWDQTVILWDIGSRKPLVTLEGHKDRVSSVAFSHDGQRIVSASEDQTVILWDVDSRKPLAVLKGHQAEVQSVAFNPDGKRLASASADHSVILWDLDVESLKTEACRTANRNLSCTEWRQYISPDVPYRKTCEALPGPAEPCR